MAEPLPVPLSLDDARTARRSADDRLRSVGSILSIGSVGSILSIGSAGSILSIGSAGSILSIGSVGSVASIGSAYSAGSLLSLLSAGSVLSGLAVGRVLFWGGGAVYAVRRALTRRALPNPGAAVAAISSWRGSAARA